MRPLVVVDDLDELLDIGEGIRECVCSSWQASKSSTPMDNSSVMAGIPSRAFYLSLTRYRQSRPCRGGGLTPQHVAYLCSPVSP